MALEAHPEVLGLDIAGIPGLGGGEVDLPQGLLHLLDHALVVGAAEDGRIQAGQGVQVAALALVRERLDPRQVPHGAGLQAVDVHAPLQLRPQQGPQPAQVDRSGAVNRKLCAAPGPKGDFVLAGHRDRTITALVGGEEVLRQGRPARPCGSDVAALVRAAQPQRRDGQFVADVRTALTVARERRLVGQPPFELCLAPAGMPFQVAQPPVAVPEAQHQLQAERRPPWADPAHHRLRHLRGRQRLRGPQELRPAHAARLRLLPLSGVHRAHRVAPPAGPRAVDDCAAPRIDRVRRRDLQHPAAQHRVELWPVGQRGEHLQPITSRAGILLRQQRQRRHFVPPQTVRRAASNTGSRTSTWP